MGTDALSGVDAERIAAAEAVARRLAADPVVLAGPAPAAFGPPRAVLITAEAAVRHRAVHAETADTRVQLETGAGHDEATVRAARARLATLGAELRAAIGDGVLVLPTLPEPPPRWDDVSDVGAQLRATGRLTRLCGPVHTSGLVAVSVPVDTDAAGRPIGVQLVAAAVPEVLAAALRLD